MSAPAAARLWEVDLARTVAILMMVAYHAAYDVDLLGPGVDIDPFSGGWRALQVATGSSFLAVVGVSVAVASGRARARGLGARAVYRRRLRRAGEVAAAALLVSAATRVALGDDYVRFGILHCIAAGMVIAPLLVPLGPGGNAALAAAVLAAGLLVRDAGPSDVPGLMVVGVPTGGGEGVDWYPLLPWLAPLLLGLAAGLALYPGGRRGPWGARLREPRGARALGAPGRHALPIYLVHQPLLIPLVAGALALAGVEVSWDRFT
ncbi:heparan-alpha-glucosaminide N-acetyltransferase domain-containing protein [Miltoncostaea marina]|uniref:heparan-alpha-glucosaminide N-acetyltransferase domain-containing protein n=1 Tax=Miltoncostaea marina TaxID=2843215 RepID=UPI001C3E86F2|nr:heparan-alpha-glucosaminide N-acetyltransferase domain-containing protein [Miltoncostaea marina]